MSSRNVRGGYSPTAKSRRAVVMVTENPATTSSSARAVMKKNVDVAASGTVMKATRHKMNTIIDKP